MSCTPLLGQFLQRLLGLCGQRAAREQATSHQR